MRPPPQGPGARVPAAKGWRVIAGGVRVVIGLPGYALSLAALAFTSGVNEIAAWIETRPGGSEPDEVKADTADAGDPDA